MKTPIIIAGSMLAFITIGTIIYNCNSGGTSNNASKSPSTKISQNTIVLLDLSDRILVDRQVEYDSAMVIQSFNLFEQKAKAGLLVNSKDRFQVMIAPQADVEYNREEICDDLTFDLSKIKAGEKVKKLKEFKNSLSDKIHQLYKTARFSNVSKDYSGSQLWQYFNDELPMLTSNDRTTQLILLTDGYFDFENNTPELKDGNKSTKSNFIEILRSSGPNWKDKLSSDKYGILPIQKKNIVNLNVITLGIRSKVSYLREQDILTEIWKNWLTESGFNNKNYKIQPYSGISNSSSLLEQNINSFNL
jgi:hypothetical protein